jgi:hypothetical protein
MGLHAPNQKKKLRKKTKIKAHSHELAEALYILVNGLKDKGTINDSDLQGSLKDLMEALDE